MLRRSERLASRRGVSGLIASILLFAMLFTTGAAYFLFVTDSQFNLQEAAKSTLRREMQQTSENVFVDASKLDNGHLGVSLTNTGTSSIQVKQILVLDANSRLLKNIQSPTLPITLNVQGKTSTPIDTNVTVQQNANYTIRAVTDRGSLFSSSYPDVLPRYALQAESSGALTIDMSTFRFLELTGNMQSGNAVGGYPAVSIPSNHISNSSLKIAFKITFTNRDYLGRSVTLWPGSSMTIMSLKPGGDNAVVTPFYIVDAINTQVNGVIAYNSTKSYATIPVDTQVTLYFGSRYALSPTLTNVDSEGQTPFTALFTLTGVYSDATFFGQTIPFPAGTVTDSTAALSATSGNTGASITVTAGNNNFISSTRGYIGWINSTGILRIVKTFTTTSVGGISTNFNVPTDATGYDTVIVSDYVNSVPFTFRHN
ncbi:MAG: hypothetical protein M1503_04070 [Thaumarchaeota archaeon]|nr:hypothetical protein [Nitrososphaerota archaeon]MCL5317429.1 hypothetical protein [Nitrososphaerota archaeon]